MLGNSHRVPIGIRQHHHIALAGFDALAARQPDPAAPFGDDVKQDKPPRLGPQQAQQLRGGRRFACPRRCIFGPQEDGARQADPGEDVVHHIERWSITGRVRVLHSTRRGKSPRTRESPRIRRLHHACTTVALRASRTGCVETTHFGQRPVRIFCSPASVSCRRFGRRAQVAARIAVGRTWLTVCAWRGSQFQL